MTDITTMILTDVNDEKEILRLLKGKNIAGVSGKFVSEPQKDLFAFKKMCEAEGIPMATFESSMDFSEFKLNENGLIPVVTQNYKTGEVLMVAYMDREAFENTVKTGIMISIWIKIPATPGAYRVKAAFSVFSFSANAAEE